MLLINKPHTILEESITNAVTQSTENQLENQGKVKARIRVIEQKEQKKDAWIEVD